jgi:hypothetical protein
MAAAKQAIRRGTAVGPRTRELEAERRGGVLVLTLARPERRNSLSEAMLAALQGEIDGAAKDAASCSLRRVPPSAPGTT